MSGSDRWPTEAAETAQSFHPGEPEGLDPVPASVGGLAPCMPAGAEMSLWGPGNHTCPPEPPSPQEEVGGRPLREAGRLRETCQAGHERLHAGCFSSCSGSLADSWNAGFGGKP